MPDANEDGQGMHAGDGDGDDVLAPLVEALLAAAGLPPEELALRVREAVAAATRDVVESNRRLRDAGARRDALAAAAAAELRAVSEALLSAPGVSRPDEAAHLRRIAEDLERSAAGGDDPDVVARTLPRYGGSRPRVLVADDDADAREALAEVLQPECEVVTAADGAEALQIARDEHPDLVLMDLFMPKVDGLEALERMRSDPSTAEVPVIFVSARGEASVKARALDLGAVDYLQKPFSDRELRARVERTLRLARSQTALRALAQTDPLTGLANMRAFRARLEDEVKRARRYRTPLTCVMADMDQLKPVNDQLGHTAGDRAIAGVASVIRAELRETDFGARYGGDEFVLLLPHTGTDEGRVLAERICARLRETVLEVGGRRVPIGASFGVACLPDGSGEGAAEALVRAADAALYRAKHAGRGRVATATPGDVEVLRENV
jgi:diguanylate cyclase (GGDEF)-like protein